MAKRRKTRKILVILTAIAVVVGGLYFYARHWYKSMYNEMLEASRSQYNQDHIANADAENGQSGENTYTTVNNADSGDSGPGDAVNGNDDASGNSTVGDSGDAANKNGMSAGSADSKQSSADSGQDGKGTNGKSGNVNSGNNNSEKGKDSTTTGGDNQQPGEKSGTSLADVVPPIPLPVDAGKVEQKAESIVGKDIAVSDYILAGTILLGKLSPSEIKYIFSVASDGMYMKAPIEEIKRIQGIVFSKLSDDDLQVLMQIGRKYGRKMYILDKNIDVEKFREGYYDGKLD